ncbi:SDR family NAD(P)-dependent oxidoreductase [Streptomyces sp. NPDC085995]|uniref:SDR family NAD(P)-dependent oxidoreductase n=1 Tax=Streptomyces sp. NPDC085995 TaxID=3154861 RepID=UPI003416694D
MAHRRDRPAATDAVTDTDTDTASFDRRLAVATRAPFRLAGALAPGMAERGHGSIVPAGSGAARTPAPVGAAHGTSTAAVGTPRPLPPGHRVRAGRCAGHRRLAGTRAHGGRRGDARRPGRPDGRDRRARPGR